MYRNHIEKLKNKGYIATEVARRIDGKIGGIRFKLNYNKLDSLDCSDAKRLSNE